MINWLYDKIFELIGRYGSPPETRGKDTEETLKLKKYYEEQANANEQKGQSPASESEN